MSSPVSVTLSVPGELVEMGSALQTLIADIVAKKSITSIASDVLPSLMAAGSALADLGSDLKSSADARAYLGVVLEKALDPLFVSSAPAVSAPAP